MSMITVVTEHHKSDGHIHEYGKKREEEGQTEMKGISNLEYIPISINIIFAWYFH